MFKMNRPAKGFTLIELLVVIAIIGVLSAIVIASLNSTRLKARNAERAQTVRELAKAFILAYDANNSYPNTGGGWQCVSTSCAGATTGTLYPNVNAAIAPYISGADPVQNGSGTYGFVFNSSVTTFSYNTTTFPSGSYLYYYAEGSNYCPIGLQSGASGGNPAMTPCVYQLP